MENYEELVKLPVNVSEKRERDVELKKVKQNSILINCIIFGVSLLLHKVYIYKYNFNNFNIISAHSRSDLRNERNSQCLCKSTDF